MSALSITLYCTSRYAGAALSFPVTAVGVVPHDETSFDVFIANVGGPCSASDCTKVAAFLATLSWLAPSVASVQPAVLQPVTIALDVYVPNVNTGTAAGDVQSAISVMCTSVGFGKRMLTEDVTLPTFQVGYVQDLRNATINGGTAPVTIAENAIPSPTTTVTVHGTG